MKVVADTSVFLAAALEEPEKAWIVTATSGYGLAAPECLPFEIGNALSRAVKKRRAERDKVARLLEVALSIEVELRRVNLAAALELAVRHNIYAYDAYFIQCAIELRSPLLTLDRRMRQVASKETIAVIDGDQS
jgi:predicted nucleic acid-binding protein